MSQSTSRQAGAARLAHLDGTDLTVGARVRSPRRRGVTLIELLVTITIISILAAAVLGVAAVAGETAREAKTRTIISRLHTLLMDHYDTYTSRRVKLRPNVINAINTVSTTTAQKGRLKAEARLYALRELILMEVPDRWSDVLLNDVPSSNLANATANDPLYFDAPSTPDLAGNPADRTELPSVYLRTYRRIAATTNTITGSTNTRDDIVANQGAECLYMVVMNACGDGEARTLFPESSIGDTDGDGAPEFLDGWGHPIEFLRWAPGFTSEIQTNANDLDIASDPSTAWANAGATDHDPFDLYRAQPVAFRLVPLIYSLGRDEEGGVAAETTLRPWPPASFALSLQANPSANPPLLQPTLNPYLEYSANSTYLGTPDSSKTATDNIHNHLISTKP